VIAALARALDWYREDERAGRIELSRSFAERRRRRVSGHAMQAALTRQGWARRRRGVAVRSWRGYQPRKRWGMARRSEEPLTQLATRIPKELHRELKLHCVQADVKLMDFVVAALREKLATTKRAARAK
jgi:hypothetical protein